MRTIAHISDLHFGRINHATLPKLSAAIAANQADIVVVSGDLTQRARSREFIAARHFLDTLPSTQIVVPGNHDVPLYNVFARWLSPLAKYRRYISEDLAPFFSDGEVAILGLNTARSLTFKNGRLNAAQVKLSCTRLGDQPLGVARIVVTHHPFDMVDQTLDSDIVGRAPMAMEEFVRCRVDVILSGHLHLSRVGDSSSRYKIPGHAALFVQAGTATSLRGRGESNSWNLIRIEPGLISIERFSWNIEREDFVLACTDRFQKSPDGWTKV